MIPAMERRCQGFTWIELLMAISVLGILALMAIPSMQETAIKKQVKEALAMADIAKKGVQLALALTGHMPPDNAAAGLPPAEKIVGTLVNGVQVEDGAITLTFGNSAHKLLEGKKLTLRPAVVPDQPMVPIAWVCHASQVPKGMELRGRDTTDVQPAHLPLECRYIEPK